MKDTVQSFEDWARTRIQNLEQETKDLEQRVTDLEHEVNNLQT